MVDREAHAKLELSFSLRALPQMDYLSKSDPFIAVFITDVKTKRQNFIGRTETIWNNHDPDFLKLITVDYLFEQYQEVELKVYDADSNAKELEKQNFMASAKTSVAELAAAPSGKSKFSLIDKQGAQIHGKNGQSWIIVRAEQMKENDDMVQLRIRASGLPTSFGFGPATVLEFGRMNEDNTLTPVWRSQLQKRNRNPDFGTIRLRSRQLCNGDHRRPIRVSILTQSNFSSEPTLKGYVEITLAEIQEGAPLELELAHERKSVGRIYISGTVTKIYSFLDYIRHGCEISLMVAIDFTGSNGDPSDERSLHHLSKHKLNDYELAIQNVGQILAEYDTDNLFPVWGFGARLISTNEISHLFNVNWSEDANVQGVDGILDSYRTIFNKILLSGPTYFTEVIQMASLNSQEHFTSQKQRYNVLLILTDGIINDMQSTIRSIVDASFLPMSIIIVGIGDADFSAMNVLDADDNPLSYGNNKMARDIVQFVPFRDFKDSHPAVLAQAVLEEVPEQFVQYCRMRNAAPMESKEVVDEIYNIRQKAHKYHDLAYQPIVPELNADAPPLYNLVPGGLPRVSNPGISQLGPPKSRPVPLERTGTVRECVVCLDAMAEQIIVPCMHLVLCAKCAPDIQKSGKCPACRGKIDSIKKVY